jgi:hypothetical protein
MKEKTGLTQFNSTQVNLEEIDNWIVSAVIKLLIWGQGVY